MRIYRSCPTIITVSILISLALTTFTTGQAQAHQLSFVGPKQHYLALGDSMAFGYQPDLNFSHGYAEDFGHDLEQQQSGRDFANMACPGETSTTMLTGKCPYPFLRKYLYLGPQLDAALAYLKTYRGQVSPVTLNIGANNVLPDINATTCVVNVDKFKADLATLDTDLKQVILPKLRSALTVNGVMTGDLVMIGYYDPYQNMCPNSLSYSGQLNQHLANDIKGYGTMIDTFTAFGGPAIPNPNICTYTWMCSLFHDFHATDQGHRVVADAIEQTLGY